MFRFAALHGVMTGSALASGGAGALNRLLIRWASLGSGGANTLLSSRPPVLAG